MMKRRNWKASTDRLVQPAGRQRNLIGSRPREIKPSFEPRKGRRKQQAIRTENAA